jgi:hypothetical protein
LRRDCVNERDVSSPSVSELLSAVKVTRRYPSPRFFTRAPAVSRLRAVAAILGGRF